MFGISEDRGAPRWVAEATRLGCTVPDEFITAIDGYLALQTLARTATDPTAARRDAIDTLVRAALDGGNPGDAEDTVDRAIAVTRDHAARRSIYSKALARAGAQIGQMLLTGADQLIADVLRPRYVELLDQARHDRAQAPTATPNDLARHDQTLDDLTAIVLLRDNLWGKLHLQIRDCAGQFYRNVRNNDQFEDTRRRTHTSIPSRLPPALSRDWWRTMIDRGAVLWLPTPAEVRAREAEDEANWLDSIGRPSPAAEREHANVKAQAGWIADQARPRNPRGFTTTPHPGDTPAADNPAPRTRRAKTAAS
ncbi:hypothetical protein GCM10009547_48620 [Sporichthya brevicatena]|uniref:Uncharacterized protein n=1 Tax=Sporichthya brevicatena TaxID=171442 RepID=A0ABN1HD82_9ACTN